jgi:hypothetical protein
MAETNIKISLELADKAAQKALSDFISKGSSAEKSLDRLGSKGKSTFSEISIGIGKATGIYEIFVGNLTANLAVMAFETVMGAAKSLFNTFIVDGVRAAAEAEDSINALNVALAQSGQYSAETSQDIQDFAAELQRTTTFEDDLIIKNAALIQSLAGLEKEGLKRATVAALDLSAALGKDLATTSEILGRAANGNVTALQKMGVEVRKGATDAQTFENALRAIEERFGGAAASKVNTYSGAVAFASNAFGDLTEEIGNFIVKNPAVIAVLKEVGTLFNELTKSTESQNGSWIKLVGEGLSYLFKGSAFLVTMLDVVVRTFETLLGVVQKLSLPIVGLIGLFKSMTQGLDEGANYINRMTAAASKNFKAIGAAGDGVLAKLSEDLLRVGNAADKGLRAIEVGAKTMVEPTNKGRDTIRGLGDEAEKAKARLKSFAEELIKSGESSKTAADAQLEAAAIKRDQELAIEQELVDRKLLSQMDFLTRKAAIDAEFEAARIAIEEEKYAADQARLQEALNKQAITLTEFQAARKQLDDNYERQKLKYDADDKKRRQANAKALRDEEQKTFEYRMQSTASMFGGLAALAATGGKKMFEIAKAFNLAEAITAGILSIQKAAASAPPPANIPAIIGASAFAAANVIRITQTKAPSFEQGGIVPGTSFSGDHVQANVNSGEMILNREQQKVLFDVANGRSAGNSGRLEALVGELINAIDRNPVIVNIGGRTVVDTIRAELNAGRTFA